MSGIWVGGGGSCGNNGPDDAQGGYFLTLDGRIFNTISFELTGEAPVQAGMSLGIRGISGVGEAMQEVGCYNCPPCLKNRLFPKSVHLVLGALGIRDPVPVDLEEFNAREGGILDIGIDRQGGT